jgi:uncharacterized membrane protein YdbT with pleckstrin-like domain
MNPQSENPANNPLNVMSPGEQFICEIKRHPFGLFGIYIASGLLIAILLIAAMLIPHFVSSLTTQAQTGIWLAAIILSVFMLLYTYMATVIYKGNRWIVTSDSITQVSQVGLFRKQTSQLSLANLEDVTFEQNSFIQTMFGFGLLRVETAGERSKFAFQFCPNPSDYARKIIAAHEQFIAERPETMEASNRPLTASEGFNPQAYTTNPEPPQSSPEQQPPAGPTPPMPPQQ